MKKKKETNKSRFNSNSHKTASKEDLINQFLSIKENLAKQGVTFEELLKIVEKKEQEKLEQVPITIFHTDKLSALEAIVKYLKENLELPNRKIAQLLNRDSRTIWSTYANAAKKLPETFSLAESKLHIPLSLFRERKLSVLETLVMHLRDEYGMTYHQIAVLIRRDDRTVWTAASRAKEKQKHETRR